MSFLGGPECSTAANPLSQFTKLGQDDRSLQRDRLVNRGPGGLGESMRTQPMGGPQDAVRPVMDSTTLLARLTVISDDGRVYATERTDTPGTGSSALCNGTNAARVGEHTTKECVA